MTELWTAQWRLARIEVVNWGTFAGHHAVDIAREGHLITGASGSGKSSLLDAVAAVLTPDKWLRFNAAALETATGRSDRSLVSYVRGAWSKEADELEDRAVTSYLRPGTTWSGILLRYEDQESAPVTMVRLFHLRGTATDRRALTDACLITRADRGLLEFREYAERGLDVRRLKADHAPVVVTTAGSHGAFYSRLRMLLGVVSDNALQLLHKTQSAKNLGTLDMLFRNFMLDVPGTFAQADNAVEQFGELKEAYDHVVDLRQQAEVLAVVAKAADQFEAASAASAEAERIHSLVMPFAANLKRRLAQDALHDADARELAAAHALEGARAAAEEARAVLESCRLVTAKVGGSEATHLRARIGEAESRLDAVTKARAAFEARLVGVGVGIPSGATEFAELLVAAQRELDGPEPAPITYDLLDASAAARREVAALQAQVDELRHRRSNIDIALLQVRAHIADALNVPEEALPYGGELIEVRSDHADWTGAIERVLAPVSTAMLVRDDLLPQVRRHIDGMNLGLRLVVEAVPVQVPAPPRVADERSVVNRVLVTEGPFAAYLNRRLAADFDVPCVDGPDELDGVQRGVTRAGLYKRSERRYEKNDRRPVDDRATWVLGASNVEKVALLLERLEQAQRVRATHQEQVDAADARRQAALARRSVLRDVAAMAYYQVDTDAAQRAVRDRRAELERLVRPQSDLDLAMRAEQDAEESYDALRLLEHTAQSDHATAMAAQASIATSLAELDEPVAIAALDDEALGARFNAVRRSVKWDNVDNTAGQVLNVLLREIHSAQASVRTSESSFVEHATRYSTAWPVQAADLKADIADRAGYRAVHDSIVARGLPDHEQNFLQLLRDRSRDTLIHLREEIQSAPRRIASRVEPVNVSLRRSVFDEGRFLEIRVKTRRTGEVDDFLGQLRQIVDGDWAQETLASAERRFDVLAGVMRRLSSSEYADRGWRARVLDTREHVTFLAHEITGEGVSVAVHDSSAGLSGGQRQKLVLFCLAAALRYQLTDADQATPRYGTILLDEAFDKADARYARMAMDIFIEFGFHMVLATPQKLLQTLEPYIGAVTSVANPTRKASALANVVFDKAAT